MDVILIEGLRLNTRIGVFEWERHTTQTLVLDVELALPTGKPCTSDDLADAVDYTQVVQALQRLASDHPHHLLERFAEAIAEQLRDEFRVPWARVQVAKLGPMSGVARIGVRLERGKRPG